MKTMYVTIQRFRNGNGLPVLKHKTLEERLTAFYGKPVDQIQPIPNQELDSGRAEGDEAWS